MKRTVFIGLLLLLALASCHGPRRQARQMVRRAEQLFDSLPDSTASLIDSVLRMPVYFEAKQRMDMALLQAEALFGDRGQEIPPLMDDEFFDDKPFLSTSPELERAADYYARKKKYDKAAHVALYSGFVQQHYGEKTHAMQSFKDAERYGEMVKDSLTVARAECLMGKLLYDDYMESEAIIMFKSANDAFGNHFTEKAMVQNMMSVCYMLQRDYENAEKCLQQSMAYAKQSNIDKVRIKILNNYAVLYRQQRKFGQSMEYLRLITKEFCLDNSELFMFYLNSGKTFLSSGEIDSASYYFHRMEKLLPETDLKPMTKVSAYEALFRLVESQNHDSLALQYHVMQNSLLYEVLSKQREQSIYRIQQQYDHENLQNALNRKIILRHRIILIISILLFLSTVVILVLQIRHKQMREAEAEMRMQIDDLKNNLRESVKSTYLEQELSSRIRLIILAKRTQQEAYDPKKEWNPIVIKLMNGKESVFEAVVEEMEKVYPSLYAVLRQKLPELNETETKVCLLSCSNLSNTEMAEILGVSKHTIDKNRSKLRDKLNLKPEKMKEQLHKAFSR